MFRERRRRPFFRLFAIRPGPTILLHFGSAFRVGEALPGWLTKFAEIPASGLLVA